MKLRILGVLLLLALVYPLCQLCQLVVALTARDRMVFPDSQAVINVKKHCGAKGDGKTDDTAALQRALDLKCGQQARPSAVVYIPDGVYRLTNTLVANRGDTGAGLGPWLYGETRDGVILRLDSGLQGVTAVLRTHPQDSGKTSANWFMRNIHNLTIDVNQNPEVDGIRYMANNTGIIKNVRLIGNGKRGINAGFIAESGPNTIQDVEISGFETGIESLWVYGQTLSRITIRDCRKLGIHIQANVAAIEDLRVENTPQGLLVDYPDNWTWWSGVVALVGAKFKHTGSGQPAIRNQGILFARDVQAEGFSKTVESNAPGGSVQSNQIQEYTSHPPKKLFPDTIGRSLGLPREREPEVPWEMDPNKWESVNDVGAIPGDNQDDTAAIQQAIDAAASAGVTTLSLNGVGGPDPNWYTLKGDVYIRGSVRHIIGLGFARVIGGRFIVTDQSADVVKIQNIDSFGGPPPVFENRSKSKTLVLESIGGVVSGTGKGKIFATNLAGLVRLDSPGQSMWARGLNPEGTVEGGLVQNRGSNLWIMGSKTEGKGLRYSTSAGGKTELFGAYEYATEAVADRDSRPIFEVRDASVSVAAMREVNFNGQPYAVKVQELRGQKAQRLTKQQEVKEWSLFTAAPIKVK